MGEEPYFPLLHIVRKKGVDILEREPLLFIKSPTYFVTNPESFDEVDLEESTSVFVKENFIQEPRSEESIEESDEPVNELLVKQIHFLEKPFRQELYQPLLICLKDGRKLPGAASDVQGDSFMLTSKELQTQEIIQIEDVQEILWRGRKLPV